MLQASANQHESRTECFPFLKRGVCKFENCKYSHLYSVIGGEYNPDDAKVIIREIRRNSIKRKKSKPKIESSNESGMDMDSNVKRDFCWAFLNGHCENGSTCKFAHVISATSGMPLEGQSKKKRARKRNKKQIVVSGNDSDSKGEVCISAEIETSSKLVNKSQSAANKRKLEKRKLQKQLKKIQALAVATSTNEIVVIDTTPLVSDISIRRSKKRKSKRSKENEEGSNIPVLAENPKPVNNSVIAVSKPKVKSVCFDWQKGICERGDKCRFAHDNLVEVNIDSGAGKDVNIKQIEPQDISEKITGQIPSSSKKTSRKKEKKRDITYNTTILMETSQSSSLDDLQDPTTAIHQSLLKAEEDEARVLEKELQSLDQLALAMNAEMGYIPDSTASTPVKSAPVTIANTPVAHVSALPKRVKDNKSNNNKKSSPLKLNESSLVSL